MNLERDGDVFVLGLGDGENRLNEGFLTEFNEALDEVENSPAPRALVIAAQGKSWCLGLDLEWMGANQEVIPSFVEGVHAMLARVLALGVPCAAAIQGHVFAGGAMLALACDRRIMREDRGFFCLPEVDINIPFTPGMASLIQARTTKSTAHEAMTTGRRYGGTDAAAVGLVDEAVAEDQVVARAAEWAAPLAGKNPGTLGTIKERMYAETLTKLRDNDANLQIPG